MKNLSLLFLTVILGACSRVNFAPTSSSVPAPSNNSSSSDEPSLPGPPSLICGPNQVKIQRPTRVLFVVDQSGSNVNGPYEAPGAATDPLKSFRGQVMQQFYQANRGKDNVSWGLTVFNKNYAENLMTDSSGQSVPFSPLASDFDSALKSFAAREDVGETPYRAALNMVKGVIANDLATAPPYVYYLVAFMTDGYPTDYCPNAGEVLCPGRILESQIDADVQSIVNLANGAIQFSTVYYGQSDSDAAKRLQRMASLGLGQFIDTNQSLEVKLNDILEVDQEICVEK